MIEMADSNATPDVILSAAPTAPQNNKPTPGPQAEPLLIELSTRKRVISAEESEFFAPLDPEHFWISGITS